MVRYPVRVQPAQLRFPDADPVLIYQGSIRHLCPLLPYTLHMNSVSAGVLWQAH